MLRDAAPEELCPRYYVLPVSGFSATGGGGGQPRVSLSVIDGLYHTEVYRVYAGPGSQRIQVRLARAQKECDRLNTLDPEPVDCAGREQQVHSTL